MRQEEFQAACQEAQNRQRAAEGIGTLREKSLHAVLKRYFAPYEDTHEQRVGEFVADIVGEEGIVEIQTGGLSSLKRKLDVFLNEARTTVVYPIPHEKKLYWIEQDGTVKGPRKSPKTGSLHDCYREASTLRAYLRHPNFRLCLLLVDVEEYRVHGGKRWKNGHTRVDRIPYRLEGEYYFSRPEDYQVFLSGLEPGNGAFTSKDYAKAAGIPESAARYGLYFLLAAEAVKRVGKRGNAFLYEICTGN